ncbi:MAG: hypothetical protein IJY26_00675 [Clostridia bacterium]|nr:hypothetical protein [Clostridia bacterium]
MKETITQGTTPTFSFTLPFEAIQIKSFFITFRQGERNVLEKDLSDCTTEGYEISVTLSQEETFLFEPNQTVYVQVRMADGENSAFASPVFAMHVAPVLKGGDVI